MIARISFYALGLLLMAFGVAFSVNSNLGVSPVNSLPYVLSLILKADMGNCVITVFLAYILIQILILRREFRWINLTQILFSTLFGKFVDLAKGIVGDFALPTYFGQLALLAVSIVLVAFGVSIYMGVKLINMPMEGMAAAVASKFPGKEFHHVKIAVDCLSVGSGVVLSLIFLGSMQGIREGTVICALLVGKLLPFANQVTRPAVKRICF
ncbi:MAG: DUF6198 family protein [Lachnospiraceae bacterium]|nr:DUF6198 family protein [Lachnospiraceae bacterium]